MQCDSLLWEITFTQSFSSQHIFTTKLSVQHQHGTKTDSASRTETLCLHNQEMSQNSKTYENNSQDNIAVKRLWNFHMGFRNFQIQ